MKNHMTLSEIIGIPDYPEGDTDNIDHAQQLWLEMLRDGIFDMLTSKVHPTCQDWSGFTQRERKLWRECVREMDRQQADSFENAEKAINDQLENIADLSRM